MSMLCLELVSAAPKVTKKLITAGLMNITVLSSNNLKDNFSFILVIR